MAMAERSITLPQGIQANTALRDALQVISRRAGVPIKIDNSRFKRAGIANVGDLPVKLPTLRNVQLGTVLGVLLGQVLGSYEVHDEAILVVPDTQRGNRWLRKGRLALEQSLGKKLDEKVTLANLSQRMSLGDAIKLLSRQYDFNIAVHDASFPPRFPQAVDCEIVELTPVKDAPLRHVLDRILDQVHGTYVIHDNVVVIVAKPD
jgi:hypothetical protein